MSTYTSILAGSQYIRIDIYFESGYVIIASQPTPLSMSVFDAPT